MKCDDFDLTKCQVYANGFWPTMDDSLPGCLVKKTQPHCLVISTPGLAQQRAEKKSYGGDKKSQKCGLNNSSNNIRDLKQM